MYDTPLLVSQRWFIQNTMILSNILVTCKLLSSVCNVEMILVNMFVYFTLCNYLYNCFFFCSFIHKDCWTDKNGILRMDYRQNYALKSGEQRGNKLMARFYRQFDTCDPLDYTFDVSIRTFKSNAGFFYQGVANFLAIQSIMYINK